MAGSLPPALLADDVTKDVQMTSPGTASISLSGSGSGLASLGQVIDSQIEQLGKLKTMAISEEQNWRDRETLLREKIGELEQKLAQRDKEIGRLKQALSTSGTQELLQERCAQCAEFETQCTELQDQLAKRESNNTIVPTPSATVCDSQPSQSATVFNPRPGTSRHSSDGSGTGAQASGQYSPPLSSEEGTLFTDEHREYLVEKIDITTCKKLLRRLSVPDPDIGNVFYAHNTNPYECSVQGIKVWQDLNGRKATVWTMLQALVNSGKLSVAEKFCEDHKFHTLLTRMVSDISSNDGSFSSLTSLRSIGREIGVGEDIPDTSGPINALPTPPNSPPACPPRATPLHRVLWPHLREQRNSFQDLNHDLDELAAPFTQDQLDKFAKRLEICTEERETFKTSSGVGSPASVLGAWAEFELSRLEDETEISRLSLRNLGKILRKLNKMDVRKVLLKFLHCGVLGPHFDEKLDLRDPIVSYNAFHRIATQFSAVPQGKPNWKNFASKVGYTAFIHQFETQPGGKLPGESVLETWKTGKDATIGVLYDWAVESDRSDVVEVLEEDLSRH